MEMEEICTPRSPKPALVGPALEMTPGVSSVRGERAAPVKRECLNLAVLDDSADGRRGGVGEGRLSHDFDDFSQLPQLKDQVHLGVLVDLQGDARTDGLLEPITLGPYGVSSNGKTWRGVAALVIRRCSEDRAGIDVLDLDSSSGDEGVLGICDDPGDRPGSLLPGKQLGEKEGCHEGKRAFAIPVKPKRESHLIRTLPGQDAVWKWENQFRFVDTAGWEREGTSRKPLNRQGGPIYLRGRQRTGSTVSQKDEVQATGLDESLFREQLARILASPDFSSSRHLSEFLSYAGDCALRGRTHLDQVEIAARVLGRTDFNPVEDATVRKLATHVRQRLEHYYAGAGEKDEVAWSCPCDPTFRDSNGSSGRPPLSWRRDSGRGATRSRRALSWSRFVCGFGFDRRPQGFAVESKSYPPEET